MKKPILIDIPEKIETERLLLQVPKAGYGKLLYEAILDGYEDNVQWLAWPEQPPRVEAVEEECRKHHAQFILREDIRYLIMLKNNQKVIGRCGFPPFQTFWAIPQFGISYFIAKSSRHQGYAQEAVHALITLAFKVLLAKKVEICVDAQNVASKKVPEGLNFILECGKKGGWPRRDGKLVDLLIYGMFSEKDLPIKKVDW